MRTALFVTLIALITLPSVSAHSAEWSCQEGVSTSPDVGVLACTLGRTTRIIFENKRDYALRPYVKTCVLGKGAHRMWTGPIGLTKPVLSAGEAHSQRVPFVAHYGRTSLWCRISTREESGRIKSRPVYRVIK